MSEKYLNPEFNNIPMDDRQLIEVLYPFNFWGARPFTGIPRPKYVERIKKLMKSGQIVVTKGVRRGGKTTILFQFLKSLIDHEGLDPKKTLYVNFEDPRLPIHEKGQLLDGILRAHRAFIDPDGADYLVCDEVQRLEEWEKWVRIRHDRKGPPHILVSGSSSHILSKELATLLTGRHIDLEVFPLDLSEFCRFKGAETSDRMDPEKKSSFALEYITSSMFPQVVLTEEEDIKAKMLQNIYRDILEHDIARRFEVREVEKLESVANMLSSSVPGPVTITSIRKNLDNRVSLDSVNRYFRYLEEPYLLFFLKTHSYKAKELERGPRKVYSIDNGLLQAVSHRFSSDLGKLLENAVFLDIRRMGFETYRYRGNREIDFVIWKKGAPFALINSSLDISQEKTRIREIEGLREAMKRYDHPRSVLVTLDERATQTFPEGVIDIIPYRDWALDYWPSLVSASAPLFSH